MPDEPNIGGSAGFSLPSGPDYPFHAASASMGAGGMLGTSQLQMSIDRFGAIVDKLEKLYANASKGTDRTGLPGSGRGGNRSNNNNNGGGANFSGADFGRGLYKAVSGKEIPKSLSGNQWSQGGSGQGFLGQPSFGGPGGSGGPPGGGLPGGRAMSPAGQVGGGFIAMVGAISSFGKDSLPTQFAMSSTIQQASLLAPTNGNYNNRIRAAAYGTRNNWNTLAQSAQDASIGYGILSQFSGTPTPMGNALGRGMTGAANSFGYANPGMGYGNAAQMGAQLYSPQTSFNMMQYGIGTTPLTMGGGRNSFAAVNQAVFGRIFPGQQSITPGQFAASMRPGSVGYASTQSITGYQGQQLDDYIGTLSAYNRVSNASGRTFSNVESLFNKAAKGDKGARSTLEKYNVKQTDIQRAQDVTATKTGAQATINDSFSSGLTTATASLNAFNNALQGILSLPGINQAAGGGAGMLGGLQGLSTGGGNLLAGAGGAALMARGMGLKGWAAKGAAGEKMLPSFLASEGGAAAVTSILLPVVAGLMIAKPIIDGLAKTDPTDPKKKKTLLGTKASSWWNNWDTFGKDIAKGFGFYGGVGVGSYHGGVGYHDDPNKKQQPGPSGGAGSPGKGDKKAGAGSSSKSTKPKAQASGISGSAKAAVSSAEGQLGKPYIWGGEDPNSGFDCSGLVQWSYQQAGVSMPRTSQAQWSYWQGKKRAISLDKVQEGDLIFTGGSDGTADSPGHVAMMISNNRYVEAQQTGVPIHNMPFHKGDWTHAARPTGNTAGSAAGDGSGKGSGKGNSSGSDTTTNSGGTSTSGGGGGGSPNSVTESSNVAAGLGGAGGWTPSKTTSGTTTTTASASTAGGTKQTGKKKPGDTTGVHGGGSTAANKALMKQMAESMYGWGHGAQWNALDTLEMHEAGYDNRAQNPTSTAYGQGQFLDTTWKGYGPKTSDPKLQDKYMLEYINDRYTTPTNAWAKYYQHPGGVGWYGSGTSSARRGPAVVGERGAEEIYLQGGESVRNANQTGMLPWKVKNSLNNGSSAATECSGHTVELKFGPGSVVIQQGGSAGAVDSTANSAREFVNQVKKLLQAEDLYDVIATGHKGG